MANKLNGNALNNLFNDFNNQVDNKSTEPKKAVKTEKKALKTDAKKEPKNKHIDLWLSESTKNKLYEDAKKQDQNINEYVSMLIKRGL